MEEVYQNIIIRKDIKLMEGECINKFSEKIRNSCKEWVSKQLRITKSDNTYIYPIDVFSDSIVMDIYKSDSLVDKQKYFAASYTREDNGDFKFDNLMEVERVISFKPKDNKLSISKSLPNFVEKLYEKNWLVKKYFWNGIL